MEQVTAEELSKLQKDIIHDGINKKNYTSEESELDQDSDDELIMKFVKPKVRNNQFETTAYAFALNNKMSKLRSELARSEERMRYLQLDYNNVNVKLDEYKVAINNFKTRYSLSLQENKKIVNNFNVTKYLLFTSLLVNGLFFITTISYSYMGHRIMYT